MLLSAQERIHRIDGRLHNRLHLIVRDVRKLWISCAGSATLATMNILDRAVPKCQRNNGLGFYSKLRINLFHISTLADDPFVRRIIYMCESVTLG